MFLENNSTTIVLFFMSIITLITGYWHYFNPPKKINMFYGYRTKKSMKSQEHWDFAQVYFGKLMFIFGEILLISTLIVNFFNFNSISSMFVAVILSIIGAFLIIIKTEISLNKKFKN